VLFFTGLYGLMWLVVVAGRALDHVLFPGFKRQPVRGPVFIVAPPRSGTTLTQKLLSLTQAIFLLFLHIDELWEAGFQDALAPDDRRKLMAYYRSCLQRRLYASGREKTMLSKCTQSCGTVDALLEAFPDARFITIVRHPYESAPSHVTLAGRSPTPFEPSWSAPRNDSGLSRANTVTPWKSSASPKNGSSPNWEA
jgi:hypothetical protein